MRGRLASFEGGLAFGVGEMSGTEDNPELRNSMVSSPCESKSLKVSTVRLLARER